MIGGSGSTKVIVEIALHPAESVTVTEYVPWAKLVMSSVVSLVLQLNINGGVPDERERSIVPLL